MTEQDNGSPGLLAWKEQGQGHLLLRLTLSGRRSSTLWLDSRLAGPPSLDEALA